MSQNLNSVVTVAAFTDLSTGPCVALFRITPDKGVIGTSGFKSTDGFNPSGIWKKLRPKQKSLPERILLKDVQIVKMLPNSTRFVWFPEDVYK